MGNQPDDSDGEGEDEVVESGEDQKKVRKEDASRQANVVNHWVEIVAEDEIDDETRLADHVDIVVGFEEAINCCHGSIASLLMQHYKNPGLD